MPRVLFDPGPPHYCPEVLDIYCKQRGIEVDRVGLRIICDCEKVYERRAAYKYGTLEGYCWRQIGPVEKSQKELLGG